MTRRHFLSIAAMAPACAGTILSVAATAATAKPKLDIVWAAVLDRGGVYAGIHRFRDLQAGDIIQVFCPSIPVHRDEDMGRLYKVIEGPRPTEDPETMGDCVITVQPFHYRSSYSDETGTGHSDPGTDSLRRRGGTAPA